MQLPRKLTYSTGKGKETPDPLPLDGIIIFVPGGNEHPHISTLLITWICYENAWKKFQK